MRTPRRLKVAVSSIIHDEIPIWPAPVIGLFVAIASLVIGSKRGNITVDSAMGSMAAFLFGVLLAFTIGRTRERLATVQNLVARSDTALYSIYRLIAVFSAEECDRTRELIDRHLTDQIDYRLVDHHLASDSYETLMNAIVAIEPATRQQESVYKELVAICVNASDSRALIEAATGQVMSPLEWSGLLLLLLLILSLLAVVPGGTALGAVVVGVLGGTLVTLVILLRKLDLLRWHERVTIWEPTTRMFRKMGRDPYIPRRVIDSGRYRPTGRVRVVDYPDLYPIRSTKIVTILDLDGDGSPGQVDSGNVGNSAKVGRGPVVDLTEGEVTAACSADPGPTDVSPSPSKSKEGR